MLRRGDGALSRTHPERLPKLAPKFILPIVYLQALGNPVQPSQVVEGIERNQSVKMALYR